MPTALLGGRACVVTSHSLRVCVDAMRSSAVRPASSIYRFWGSEEEKETTDRQGYHRAAAVR